nr:ferrochelatase-2, chloroplastic [Ipomoea batatas]
MAPGVTCRLISPSTPHSVTYSPWLPSKTEQMLPTRSLSLCSSQRASSSCHCFRPKFQPHPRPKSSSLLAKCSAVSAEQSLLTSTVQEVSTAPLVVGEKIGVLLLNLGGPETLEDVQPFLFNLFADPDIIRLPRLFRFLQKPLAQFISVARAPKSKEGYASIGGGSPLRRITDAQA